MNGKFKNSQDWLAYMKRVAKLYEDKYGKPGKRYDPVKARHFVTWRFGPQALIDAIARIEALEDECSRLGQQLLEERWEEGL